MIAAYVPTPLSAGLSLLAFATSMHKCGKPMRIRPALNLRRASAA